MVYAQPSTCPRKWHTETPMGLLHTYGSPNPGYKSWPYNHHHLHVTLVARISPTLSHHSSLSFIALGRSSGQHPVSSHSCWMYVRGGRPAFTRPCVGVHKSTSLMSSSPLLQQCPACLVRLTAFLCNCRLASSPAVSFASM